MPRPHPSPHNTVFENPGSADRSEYVLLFISARWCHISEPMRVIFEELLRDLDRSRPELGVRGVEIDIDEADAIMAEVLEDSAAGRSLQATDGSVRAAGKSPHEAKGRPPAHEAAREAESSDTHENDRDQLLDPVVTRELLESIDFIPMLIMLRDGSEIARFTGQLPKLRIRSGLLDMLDQPDREPVGQPDGNTADQPDADAVDRAGGGAANQKDAAE